MSTASKNGLLQIQLRHRLLVIVTVMLAIGLILPLTLAGGTGKAAPTAQAETPTPNPTSTPTTTKPILLTDPVPDPHQDGVIYFPQTGHTLRGKFLVYWQQNGGLAQFGYPLTEEFFEPDGPNNAPLQVQYFERNRFELHPENQPPYDVLLGTLGREFRQQDPPAPQLPAPALYFPETGHNLSDVFLQYWQSHGGLAVNGYPITEPTMETSSNGKQYLTQWFERSRFELHPENAGTPYEVLLGVLGRQLSEKRGYPYGWYPPFGRASDFSWLSGQMKWRAPYNDAPSSGCSILRYDQSAVEARVQLDGPGWAPFIFVLGAPPPPRVGDFLVVFGHLARPGERYRGCLLDQVPVYLLDTLQTNPAL